MSNAQRQARLEQWLLRTWAARGLWARLLWPVSKLYGALARLRREGFSRGFLGSHRVPVPVVVVGNLIAGGAGKTPLVLALIELLQQRGWRVGVISRGHGRHSHEVCEVTPQSFPSEVGDEPLLLRRRAEVPVVVGRSRVEAARHLLFKHPEVDLIVSDDGLQHLALQRDLQVMVFDERGTGNGWLLPAGPLREPLPRVCPPKTLVVYNAPDASTPLPGHHGQRRLQGLVRWQDWVSGQPASPLALQALAARSQQSTVWAAAGIARPERFFESLRQAGMRITALPLPDHHDFSTAPLWPSDAEAVVVTEKDAVKLTASSVAATPVWVAPLDFHLDASFNEALTALMNNGSFHPSPATRHGHPTA